MTLTVRTLVPLLLVLTVAEAGAQEETGWRANPRVVERTAAGRTEFNYDEARVPPYTLPDPLRTASGTRVTSPAEWRARRAELLELFRAEVYGRSPGRPEGLRFEVLQDDSTALDGAATLRRVAIHSRQEGREHTFELILMLPNRPLGRSPVFLLLNNRPPSNTDPTRGVKSGFWPAEEVIARGFGIAAIQNNDLAPDDAERFREGVIRLFEGEGSAERSPDAWAALAAWAWGASRAMDYLETDARVDAERVAVLGHSRGGKAALWAGAEDERFALVISNESGEGGAALSRRNYGETVARITSSFPHWFAPRFSEYAGREAERPTDQHMLLALMAPRAVYVASADEDLWADPRGEFLSLVNASPVFALWGNAVVRPDQMPPLEQPAHFGRLGYHVRRGTHNLTTYDWMRFLDFAETLWR
ncbi:MAG TPA: hypothetical protein VFR81_21040 [Longimicrobium sp.]|nr:hypothetical protein [Longimicrobium sp.]